MTAQTPAAGATTTPSTAVADLEVVESSLVDGPDGVELRGSRCRTCSAVSFPQRAVCYRCGSRDVAPSAVGGHGVLYSWTTVYVSSNRPPPYSVGYVDLPDDLRVFGVLAGDGLAGDWGWQVGARVAVTQTTDGWAFIRDGRAA